MNLYIHGSGILSAAGSKMADWSLAPEYHTDRLLCKEPDYAPYIAPMMLRRMSKAVRMGVAASKMSLVKAGYEKANAISVGTAFGCLQDTETFLSKMVSQNEQMLTPTAFIQSTHNTVAGQIALVTGCHGANLSFVHKGHSFEQAIIQTELYLQDHPEHKVLAGGIEELTETSLQILKHAGVYGEGPSNVQDILSVEGEGSVAGEGAAFFVVSKEKKERAVAIKDISLFVSKDTHGSVAEVARFVEENSLADIDLVMLGINSDTRSAPFYDALRERIFPNSSHAAFKHLSGEYPVASSFALGMIAEAVENGLPAHCILNKAPEKMRNILLINHFGNHYSIWKLMVAQ